MWRYVVCLLVLSGCSGQDFSQMGSVEQASTSVDYQATEPSEPKDTNVDLTSAGIKDRKIIYQANLTVNVEDFSKIESQLPVLVKQSGGYMGNVAIERKHGRNLSGHWVVRIPVDQYDQFLDGLSNLGIVEVFNQTAQDVTAEFVDIAARIANKKRLEERILKLLEKSAAGIKDVIDVEQELARVRGEIEQMEGRLRYLTNQTSFTTITIRALQQHKYIPVKAPSFLDRIKQAWNESLDTLRQFGEYLTICVVYWFPWLVIFAIIVASTVGCYRLYRKRRLRK